MAIDWYQKVMEYYEANPDSRLDAGEIESMLRDKHEEAQAQEIERLKALYLAAYKSHQVLGHIAVNLVNAKSIVFEHNDGVLLQTPLSPQGIVEIYEKLKSEIDSLQLQGIEKQEGGE